eukprot:1143883-Pelagomonas_calceolata.AAC.4
MLAKAMHTSMARWGSSRSGQFEALKMCLSMKYATAVPYGEHHTHTHSMQGMKSKQQTINGSLS